jgi:flagellar biosynthesis protein FlhA
VRQALRRLLVKPYLNGKGELPAHILDGAIEQTVENAVQHGDQSSHLALAPQAIRDILRRISAKVGGAENPVAVIASSGSRYFLRQITEPTLGNLVFLSPNEIPTEVKVVSLGVIQ